MAKKQNLKPQLPLGEGWEKFEIQASRQNGRLVDPCNQFLEGEAARSFLCKDLAKEIQDFELDNSLMHSPLREYQSFGAKFALTQKRVILGDQMGLGKTIQALAMFAHLKAKGETHFLIVCPNSVLIHWKNEMKKHVKSKNGQSSLSSLGNVWEVHDGGKRDNELANWRERGGVAITTFDTLGRLRSQKAKFAAMVIDEAHLIKNLKAKRTKAALPWLKQARHALLLTGTPMENHVGEFINLIHLINPGLAASIRPSASEEGAASFHKSVARVYLRRNQRDVLEELPPKIETPEWVPLEGRSARSYRDAVVARNFMAMRQSTFLTDRPSDSPKLKRLLQLVEEAARHNRKIFIVSYFLKVIDLIHAQLNSLSVGKIIGETSSHERERLVGEFSNREGPAVLIGQIDAMIGQNIQAGSVVILAEPQWKNTTEDQAISRCHRGGQKQSVQVHRLLAEDSVDEHMREISRSKAKQFDLYAGQSALGDAALEFGNITFGDLVPRIPNQAEYERKIIELERKRLGIEEEGEE